MAKVSRSVASFESQHVRPAAGRALIVGSRLYGKREDRRARYPQALGVDMIEGPGVDLVQDLEEELPDLGQFAHIDCLSVLEHSRRPWLLASNLERLMQPDGTIYVTVPFVWRFHDYPGDLWRFTHEGVEELFPGIRWEALAYASNKLSSDAYLKAETIVGHHYFPKTEVVGFGRRI